MAAQNKSNIKIISASNYEEFSLIVAKQIQDQLKQKADSRLALPSGHSPRGYYSILAQATQSNEIDWRKVQCFALDDYLAVDEEHSFQHFLESHLYHYTNLPAASRFNPRSYDNYDQLISQHGGIDLCLLGLGINGHIAFNEPPTIKESWTHCVFLTNSTREANKDGFIPSYSIGSRDDTKPDVNSVDSLDVVPKRAVTMGITTILASKRIILAVSGEHKKAALTRALQNPADAGCPASFLMAHPNLLVITDFAFSA